MIDIHTHILPGIDDGARDWDESRRMLEMAYSQGIRHIVATPHYSRRGLRPEIYELSARLSEEAQKIASDFKTGLGQETYYHEGLVENLKQGQALTSRNPLRVGGIRPTGSLPQPVSGSKENDHGQIHTGHCPCGTVLLPEGRQEPGRTAPMRLQASNELQQPGGERHMEPGGAVVPQAGFGRQDPYPGYGHAQDGLQETRYPGKPWMAGKTCWGTCIKCPGQQQCRHNITKRKNRRIGKKYGKDI